MKLLNNSAVATGATFDIKHRLNRTESNLYTLYADGIFGTGNVKLQISPDQGVTWYDVPNTTVTAKSVLNVEFRAHAVRGVVTGDSTGVNLTLL